MKRKCEVTAWLCLTGYCLMMASCSDVEYIELSDATLEGKVTCNGQPVPYALVIVASSQAPASTGAADESGYYQLKHVPLGEVQVAVNTDAGRGMMMGRMMAGAKEGKGKGDAPKFVDVPKKFHDPATSGITTTITDGPNTFNIEVK